MKSSEVSRHYDRLDVWYRSLWGEHLHHGLWEPGTTDRQEAAFNLLRAVAKAAHLQPGMRVCDVGCGYGGPARWLAAATGLRITAVTNSEKQFAALQGTVGPVEPMLADWMENGLANASFDAVLAIESTPHFPDLRHGLAEMLRVLKPGGLLVMAMWIEGDDLPVWAKWLLLEPIRNAGAMPGLRPESAHLQSLIDQSAEISVSRIGSQVKRTWSSGMAVALRALVSDADLRKEALRHPIQAFRLALSSVRIWVAYCLGVLDYAIIRVEKAAVVGSEWSDH